MRAREKCRVSERKEERERERRGGGDQSFAASRCALMKGKVNSALSGVLSLAAALSAASRCALVDRVTMTFCHAGSGSSDPAELSGHSA